ncbi:hypothetical protein EVAR_31883_1 [Eumeta japonica]|uniref:Uncharacterized protein n=1 Tax=Eumeta variegata TaxID=151549 RepID=A0A4C1WWT0_EUMVA|nr:hypothetical protein EVAR_31883_1 [Eumeta japonica]
MGEKWRFTNRAKKLPGSCRSRSKEAREMSNLRAQAQRHSLYGSEARAAASRDPGAPPRLLPSPSHDQCPLGERFYIQHEFALPIRYKSKYRVVGPCSRRWLNAPPVRERYIYKDARAGRCVCVMDMASASTTLALALAVGLVAQLAAVRVLPKRTSDLELVLNPGVNLNRGCGFAFSPSPISDSVFVLNFTLPRIGRSHAINCARYKADDRKRLAKMRGREKSSPARSQYQRRAPDRVRASKTVNTRTYDKGNSSNARGHKINDKCKRHGVND